MSGQADIAALLYLAAGVLFILALKGLSSPATSQTGNRNGMIGMALAIATTLWVANVAHGLDRHAATGGAVPSLGRPGSGADCGGGTLFAGCFRLRQRRRHPHPKPD